MKCRLAFLLTMIPLSVSTSAIAHHAVVSTYDPQQTTSVQGVVTSFLFKNPHARVYFDVTNSDGSVTQWVGDGSASTILRREGWTPQTLQAGDFIQIIGSSSRDDSPMVMMDSVSTLNEDGSIAKELYGSVEDFSLTYDSGLVEIPSELAEGIPNLTGIWTGQGSPYSPPRGIHPTLSKAGLALQEVYDITNDPQVFCDTPGIVRQGGMTPHGVKITQYDDRVVFDYEEYGISHTAYFDASKADSGVKTHMGESIARYLNGALIVSTKNLLSEQMHANANRMSDQATVVQTYTRVDEAGRSSLIEIETMISDPVNFVEDFTFSNIKVASEPYEFIENDCVPPLRQREKVHPAMNMFVTSAGLSNTVDSISSEQADLHCKTLAGAVGQAEKNWLAYFGPKVNEPGKQIGSGPWYDAKGDLITIELAGLSIDDEARESIVTELGVATNRAEDDGLFFCFVE